MPRIECRPDQVFPELLEARLLIPGEWLGDAPRVIAVVPLTWDWLGWGKYAFAIPRGNGHVHMNLTCRGPNPDTFGLHFSLYGSDYAGGFLKPVCWEFALDVSGQSLALREATVPLTIVIAPAPNQSVNPDEPYHWPRFGAASAWASDSNAWDSSSAGWDVCDVTGITPDNVLVPVGTSQLFSAEGANLGSVMWRSDDSQPDSGNGPYFTTTWNQPGSFVVSAQCTSGLAVADVKAVTMKEIVVKSGGTEISRGPMAPPKTKFCAAVRQEGEQLILRAVLDPDLGEDELGDLEINWTNGEAVPSKKLQRAVSRDQAARFSVTANLGTNSVTMMAYIIWSSRTEFRPRNGQRNDDPFPNFSGAQRTIPLGLFGPVADGSFITHVQSQFRIQPPELIADGNNQLFIKKDITWDLRREGRALKLRRNQNGWRTAGTGPLGANSTAQWGNDTRPRDKMLIPWGTAHDGCIYVHDRPNNGNVINDSGCIKYSNFREWATVNIKEGGQTRCSDDFLWFAHRAVEQIGPGQWREIPAGTNACGEGNRWDFVIPAPINGNFPTITTTSPLANGQVGAAYQQAITATPPPNRQNPVMTYELAHGNLPPGLTLNRDTGALSGTPTEAGVYAFFIQVYDRNVVGLTPASAAVREFTLTIAP